MSVNKLESYTNKKLLTSEIFIIAFVVIASPFIAFNAYSRVINAISVPSSSISVISSVNYTYIFALNYIFIAVDIIVGILVTGFGILSFYAFYRHRRDNAPLVSLISNLNTSNNSFFLIIVSAILVLFAIIAFLISVLSNYASLPFLSGVVIGTVAFVLLSVEILSLSLRYVVRFAFKL
ncbi:MAG: hypothetical protein BJBARM5_0272 [Candidatus Parvarchaeum acidophilus ARMAN-5]|jgi:hypothetical protein|uniref:Uncharacterized protein n=1 Tax=Candidatus Parvarchaeum acidophilus ARMAN-5 TaxID=662762 RepID=D6GUX3_PARA5|nr:MAG: hypothetical protein BJBARM5_0272 [Candidatus Parvarchaeum acidophilus ARMAN-5]